MASVQRRVSREGRGAREGCLLGADGEGLPCIFRGWDLLRKDKKSLLMGQLLLCSYRNCRLEKKQKIPLEERNNSIT